MHAHAAQSLKLLGAHGSPYSRTLRAVLRFRRIPRVWILRGSKDECKVPENPVRLMPVLVFPGPEGRYNEAAVDSITQCLFHCRWACAADVDFAARVFPRWGAIDKSDAEIAPGSKFVTERQAGRLGVVGSNATTAPVIEASYHVEDLSGLDAGEADWIARSPIPETLRALFCEVGRIYAPFLLANARALAAGASRVECELDGKPWVQQPFPYQGKCLAMLRAEREKLASDERSAVDALLAGTGCENLFASGRQ